MSPRGGWLRNLPRALAVLMMLGLAVRARAQDEDLPSKEFLEYLGTIEAEDDDWTIFESRRAPADREESPSQPEKEKSPTPPAGDEP